MTEFNVAAMRSLQRDLDAACTRVASEIQSVLSSIGGWPEGSSVGDPSNMWGIWAKAWQEEMTSAHDTMVAASSGLANVATILEQVDAAAAAAFGPTGQ